MKFYVWIKTIYCLCQLYNFAAVLFFIPLFYSVSTSLKAERDRSCFYSEESSYKSNYSSSLKLRETILDWIKKELERYYFRQEPTHFQSSLFVVLLSFLAFVLNVGKQPNKKHKVEN